MSGTGKSSVIRVMVARGYKAVAGDRWHTTNMVFTTRYGLPVEPRVSAAVLIILGIAPEATIMRVFISSVRRGLEEGEGQDRGHYRSCR
jgi:hypothetical protein